MNFIDDNSRPVVINGSRYLCGGRYINLDLIKAITIERSPHLNSDLPCGFDVIGYFDYDEDIDTNILEVNVDAESFPFGVNRTGYRYVNLYSSDEDDGETEEENFENCKRFVERILFKMKR